MMFLPHFLKCNALWKVKGMNHEITQFKPVCSPVLSYSPSLKLHSSFSDSLYLFLIHEACSFIQNINFSQVQFIPSRHRKWKQFGMLEK